MSTTTITLSDQQLQCLIGENYHWDLGASALYRFSEELAVVATDAGQYDDKLGCHLHAMGNRAEALAAVISQINRQRAEAGDEEAETEAEDDTEAPTEANSGSTHDDDDRETPGTLVECHRQDIDRSIDYLRESLTPEIVGDLQKELNAVLDRVIERVKLVPVDCGLGDIQDGAKWRNTKI